MAHIGRTYPYYNPARVYAGYGRWPYLYPTEFSFVVADWVYTSTPGNFPLYGRGVLPIYTPSALPLVTWQTTLTGADGTTLVLGFRFFPINPPGRYTLGPYVEWQGIPQLTVTYLNDEMDTSGFPNYTLGSEYIPAPRAQYCPTEIEGSPILWSRTPPPPASSPF